MPDKHSDTDEVREAIKEAAMYGFIEGAYDVHGIPEQSIDALFNLLTSEKRKLLERLKANAESLHGLGMSYGDYTEVVDISTIDHELEKL